MQEIKLIYNQGRDGDLIKYIAVNVKEIFNEVTLECKKVSDRRTKTPVLICHNERIDDKEQIERFFKEIVAGEFSTKIPVENKDCIEPQRRLTPAEQMLKEYEETGGRDEEPEDPADAITKKLLENRAKATHAVHASKEKVPINMMSESQLDDLYASSLDNVYNDFSDF